MLLLLLLSWSSSPNDAAADDIPSIVDTAVAPLMDDRVVNVVVIVLVFVDTVGIDPVFVTDRGGEGRESEKASIPLPAGVVVRAATMTRMTVHPTSIGEIQIADMILVCMFVCVCVYVCLWSIQSIRNCDDDEGSVLNCEL